VGRRRCLFMGSIAKEQGTYSVQKTLAAAKRRRRIYIHTHTCAQSTHAPTTYPSHDRQGPSSQAACARCGEQERREPILLPPHSKACVRAFTSTTTTTSSSCQ
jgi:hypothetical protein